MFTRAGRVRAAIRAEPCRTARRRPRKDGMTSTDATGTWHEFDQVVSSNNYMVLATADGDGMPWATPVFFRRDAEDNPLWVSSPASRHSLNIATRPQVAATIFDSGVAVGQAGAAYLAGTAALVPEPEIPDALRVLNGGLPAARHLSPPELTGDAPMRAYRLTVAQRWILVRGGDPRTPEPTDSRLPVSR
jgi:hypothetical protein